MAIVEIEHVRGFMRKILPVAILPIPYDDIEEIVDESLEQSNNVRAEKVAINIRDHWMRGDGPMWAEYRAFLKDGRNIWLQASDDALEIIIKPVSSDKANVHIRFDRNDMTVPTYDESDPTSPYGARNPKVFSRFEVSREFASVLGQIEEMAVTVEKPQLLAEPVVLQPV